MGIWGQDWSSYQSAMPDTTGLSFAFVKVTQGTSYINPAWVSQRDHALAAGLVTGLYHYPDMGHSVQSEADYFLSQVAWKPGYMACLDWEGYDSVNQAVPKAEQARYKDAWLHYVKGKLPHNPIGVYCNTDYWRNVDTTSYYADFLWIATAGRPAGDPGIKAPWLFHQFSDSPVDKDYCHLASAADLRSWALSFQSKPAPSPAPSPSPAPAPTPSSEDDMPSFTIDGKESGVTFARGRYTNVSFFADNTLTAGATDKGAKLRVVVWESGVPPHITEVVAGNAGSQQVTVHFPNPSMTHSVTVTREDATTYPVYGEVS